MLSSTIKYDSLLIGTAILSALVSAALLPVSHLRAQQSDIRLRPTHHWQETKDLPLTRLDLVRFGPSGRVFISQYGVNSIGVFQQDGEYLYSVGEEGDGPGEFRNLGWFGLEGDTLLRAVDSRLGRVTSFTLSGELLNSRRTGTLQPWRQKGFKLWSVLSNGNYLLLERFDVGRRDNARSWQREVVVVSPDGQLVETLPSLTMTWPLLSISIENSGQLQVIQPFTFSDLVRTAPDGEIVVVLDFHEPTEPQDDTSISVSGFDADGSELFERTVRFEPIEWDDKVAESWVSGLLDQLAPDSNPQLPSSRVLRTRLLEKLYTPQVFPPIPNRTGSVLDAKIRVDAKHRVWIRRRGPEAQWMIVQPHTQRTVEATANTRFILHAADDDSFVGQKKGPVNLPHLLSGTIERMKSNSTTTFTRRN